MPKKIKVMIVDDETDFLAVVKLNLESTNRFEVITLSSAENILSHAKGFKPDIILMDSLMPKVDGRTACKTLNIDKEKRDHR